jgi:DNA repair exonuclease SbcCD ATPase subunit
MKIKSLYIKNFFSIQELHLDLETKGITCIEGKNKDTGGSIGVGKSSIYEAMVWGLFGRTIRKSVQDSLVNNKAKKECQVTIQLDEEIEICRVVKPPYLHIKIGDKTHIKESYQDTQKFIEDTLSINYKSFLVANVFGQQNEVDFISASLEDKRIMLKTFLGLEEFFTLRDKFKLKKTEVTNKIKSIEYTIESNSKIVTKAEKSIKTAEDNIKAIKEKFKLTSNYRLEDIVQAEKAAEYHKKKRDLATNNLININKSITTLEIRLKSNTCKYCDSTLTALTPGEVHDIGVEIEESKVYAEDLAEEFANYDKEYKLALSSIPISSSEYYKIKDIENHESDLKTNITLKKEHEELIKEELARKEKQNKYLEILKFWEIVFSEQGIVKYIIHNVLDHFNNRCMYYLSILTNGKGAIKFNDSFEESITINGLPTYYHSLSGGERKKINLAVLLALQSLLDFTSKAKFDLILLDEVVESIDDESISSFYSLLNELSKNKAVYIISHNTTLKEYLTDKRKIKLVKSKGVTKLEKN